MHVVSPTQDHVSKGNYINSGKLWNTLARAPVHASTIPKKRLVTIYPTQLWLQGLRDELHEKSKTNLHDF